MNFDRKFVYSEWDDVLTDKICYVATNISDLKRAVEEEKPFFKQKVKKGKDDKIYVNLSANISVIMPLSSRNFESLQQVLISESVIIGQVPEVYLYSDNLDTLLNFVPY